MLNHTIPLTDISVDDLSKTFSSASDEDKDYVCFLVGSKYLHFGLELKFHEEKIDAFEKDYERCNPITKKIIEAWIHRDGNEATWMVLGDALYEIEVGVQTFKDMMSDSTG